MTDDTADDVRVFARDELSGQVDDVAAVFVCQRERNSDILVRDRQPLLSATTVYEHTDIGV